MSDTLMYQQEAICQKLQSLVSAILSHIDNYNTKFPSQISTLSNLLTPLTAHPIIKATLGDSHQPTPSSPPTDLQIIQSFLASLTKLVTDLQKKVNPTPPKSSAKAPQAPSRLAQKTYLAITRSKPTCHSVVVSLANLKLAHKVWPTLEVICNGLNAQLAELSPTHPKIATVHWTAKGNLIIFRSPSASPSSLQTAAPHISNILSNAFQLPPNSPLPPARTNSKWSKITLNSIPTGTSTNRGPYSPQECHAALIAHNSSYTTLTIMQLPSWVHSSSSYTPGTSSSLCIAFKDKDRTKLRMLLANHYLFCFSNRATVHKWK
jgi:hypothetical protein